MTSFSGNKDRSRNRKHAMMDCSPTKSTSVSLDSWYRKTCEESRSGFRPVLEGAHSIPGSSGTPSPGSGTSSPGSFSSSPGTASPGIGTSSPGSLGGSPGFGTGSPASGSGSSPGSERGTWCDTCTSHLVELKRHAAKLLLPGPYSSKDLSFCPLLQEKLQIPSSPRKAWNEQESRCEVCFTHLSQLKQEAVRLVLTCDVSSGSPPTLTSLVGTKSFIQGSAPLHLSGSHHPVPPSSSNSAASTCSTSSTCSTACSVSNVSISSPQHTKHGTKPNTPGVERKSSSLSHTHPENTWSPTHLSCSNGLTLLTSQMPDSNIECMSEASLHCCNTDRLALPSAPPPAPPTTATSTGASAAVSFFARAAQKLNLSSKKKKQKPTPTTALTPPLFPSNFSGILQLTPPPAPPCLLRAVGKVRDNPGLGKVKVMLRVCAVSHAESSSFLKVDCRKKQVSIMDPAVNSQHTTNQKRGASTQALPRIFTFDSAFSHDSSQAEVCAGTVAEVIQSVVNGADGCVFCFGHAKLGKTYTMIGKDDSMQNLGIIPCAVSWLFKIITERKEKTGTRFSVRVSAVEVWGRGENLRDLLADMATGSLQDGQAPGVYLCEDPICGMQLQNQSELRAPTAEKAAFFLDAALAARYGSRGECNEDEHGNSHMLFTLHVYQYRMEKSGKGGMSGGRSRLHLIDLGSCVKQLAKPCESATPSPCLSLAALGNVILALVNGSKHIPYKDSKLAMLLRESLGNMNCRTTMIAHISSSPSHFSETLSTLQIASRVLRMKKKKTKQYTSSSSGGESSCEEGRMRRPTQLRNIHSRNVRHPEIRLLHISSDPDDYSSSEQSCDTVIYVGPNGSALSDKELTDNEGPPEFVPIVPSILKNKSQQGRLAQPSQLGDSLIQPPQGVQSIPTLHPHTLPPVLEETADFSKKEKDCLKCNTFAELQERLGCIDGSEEVNTFPFEEVPASRLKNLEPLPSCTNTSSPKRISNDQQLEELREVVEEAEIAQSIIESLTKSTVNSCATSVSGVTGVGQLTALQRANSLQNSRESISGGSSSDGKTRSMGSPRLGIASLTKTTEYKPSPSPSQRSKVYTQKGVMPNTPPQSSQNLYGDSGKSSMESLLQAEFRTSPVGMSSQVLKRSSSSRSLGSVDTLCDDVPQLPLDSKNSTSVTLQQLLEPQGEDGLIFTLVKERTVNGIMEDSRPTSIISFNSERSIQAPTSGSQPISSMHGDLECYSNSGSVTTSTTSELAKFPPLNKDEGAITMRQWSSGSSWPTELITGGGGEQSCHSFVKQQCLGQGDTLAELQLLGINEEEELTEQIKEDGNVFCGSETSTKMFSTSGKTAVTVSTVQSFCTLSSFSHNKTNTTSQTSAPLIINDPPIKLPSVKDSRSSPVPFSNEMIFKDPWMKMYSFSPEELELKVEKGTSELIKSISVLDRNSSSSCEADGSPDSFKRVIDGWEMVLNASETITPVFPANILRTGSLPRAWHRLNKQEDLDESSNLYVSGEYKPFGVTTSTPCSPRATLERRGSSGRQGFFTRPKGTPPLPPVRKSSLDQRNRAGPQHNSTSNQGLSLHLSIFGNTPKDHSVNGKQTGANFESTRLFSAKLELLANRTNSLGKSHVTHYDCHSLERRESLMPVVSKAAVVGDGTMPRVGRSATRNSVSSPTNGQNFSSNASYSPKSSQSKISAVTKLLMASPKSRILSTSGTKTLSFSTKSLPQSVNRSSSLAPNGKNPNQNSWSTQSLSRNRGSGLASKLPLRAVNGRISELLQGSAGQTGPGRGMESAEERGATIQGAEKPVVHTLPSPYSKITAPRRPHRCSSGHASDNSSVLSGELPPAMGKTALFYHSGGSSGYESMMRDSEATGSTSSAQESMSDTSSLVSGRRSLKNPKKKTTTGSQRRRLIPSLTLDPTSPVRKPILSPGVRWVDGPLHPPQRGLAEPFEIKVYEIDHVERLQRRRPAVSKGVVCFSAKLKILEHRQQRISEIRTKYEWLKKELEQTKQHLMLEPEQWSAEFDVEPVFEVDSLEYLEALEFVTQRLETRVNFCKAHLMMVTCFDVTCRRR